MTVPELAVPAFIAGLLMFFAPCTFPLVPAFFGIIGGLTSKNLASDTKPLRARFRLLRRAFLFVFGFTSIFIFFGTAFGWGGHFLFPYRDILARVAGIFIILFGVTLLGVWRLPLFRAQTNLRIRIRGISNPEVNSFLVGSAFGVGWTPCVGPILGSILLVATTTGTAGSGAVLLGIFSLGLAIPFLLVALALGSAQKILGQLSRAARTIEIISGVALVALGYLVFANQFTRLIVWGYRIFGFLNYDRLLDYL